jgi:hypothetical protein
VTRTCPYAAVARVAGDDATWSYSVAVDNVNVVVVDPPVADTTTTSCDPPAPSRTTDPATIVATDADVVNAVDPAGSADAASVYPVDVGVTPEHVYTVFPMFWISTGLDPAGSGIPLNWLTFTPPTHTVLRPMFASRSVLTTFGTGLNTHVGVTAGFRD